MHPRAAFLTCLVSEPACLRDPISFTNLYPPGENGIFDLPLPLLCFPQKQGGLLRRTPSPALISTSSQRGPAPFLTPRNKDDPSAILLAGSRKQEAGQEEMAAGSSLPRGEELLILQDRRGGLTGSMDRDGSLLDVAEMTPFSKGLQRRLASDLDTPF